MKTKMIRSIGLIAVAALFCLLLAGCVPAGTAAAGTQTTGEAQEVGFFGQYGFLIMMVVIIAVFYFLTIRPEKKKRKKAEEMRNNLAVGDKITTIGGMVGKIVHIGDDLITFESGEDRVRIQVTKWAISTNSIQKAEDGGNN